MISHFQPKAEHKALVHTHCQGRPVVVLLAVMALCSCASHQGMKSPMHGEMIPKHPNWSRAATEPSDASIMPDPDSLYVTHHHWQPDPGIQDRYRYLGFDGYHFYRFWPNGRLLYRNALIEGRELTAADGDSFGAGTLPGRYSVKDGQITVEVFNMLGEYELRKGTLFPGGIVLSRDHFRSEQKIERMQLPRGAMTKQPDW